jgi:hypothetical protein
MILCVLVDQLEAILSFNLLTPHGLDMARYRCFFLGSVLRTRGQLKKEGLLLFGYIFAHSYSALLAGFSLFAVSTIRQRMKPLRMVKTRGSGTCYGIGKGCLNKPCQSD